MPAAALALVLAAAVVHATWNALGKRGLSPLCFLWSATAVATALFLPLTVAGLWRDGLPAAALPFVAATIVVHALYFVLLSRAYAAGDYSVVYPVARGLGVALVPVLALALFGERLSALGTVGVLLVVAGIVAFQWAGRGWRGVLTRLSMSPGTPWAVLTGLMTASYSLIDKAGVGHLHPVPYIGLMFAGMTVVLLPLVLADRAALAREWRANWRPIVFASWMTLAGYLLVLFAFRLSKTGYVVAARESSIVVAAVIGHAWLKEGPLGPRLGPAVLILAGVACVALAR